MALLPRMSMGSCAVTANSGSGGAFGVQRDGSPRRRFLQLASDIHQIGRKGRAFLDEQETGFRLVAHQTLDGIGGLVTCVVLDDHFQQAARFRIHGGQSC